MQLKQLLSDDDAVSPVIGVILMVAITVILAAVIATFVLGLGEQVSSTAPQASFSFEYNDGDSELSVTHDGGGTIAGSNLYFRGQINNDTSVSNNIKSGKTWADLVSSGVSTITGSMGSTKNGESAVVGGDYVTFGIKSDSQLSLVYEGSNSENSATLASWEGPDA
ncbi:type IV pilin [Halorientalis salina]|uniref:type IV pilin n=1 Tax=Halorientalis salina TaxID=2932266 RepID=UPI0010AC90B6|nr:type IV pilin N-terminal domain-containing protein [Halorientalis salina]